MAKQESLDKQVEKQHEEQAQLAKAQAVNSGQTYQETDEVPISQDEIKQAEIMGGRDQGAGKTVGG